MAAEDQEPRSVVVRGFLAGLVIGLVVGLLAVIVPVMGFVLLVAGVVAALVSAWGDRTARTRGLSAAAGFLMGLGALFLWGSWNTISACVQTDDFCGDANVVPLLALAIALLVVGLVIAAVAVVSVRRAVRQD
jgi:apolipoprotein N-acyltransferase